MTSTFGENLMKRSLTIIPILVLLLGSCRDSDETEIDSGAITRANLIGRWRLIDGQHPWAYEFMENGKCATYVVQDEDPFGSDDSYDYFHGFRYYWYLGTMEGADIIILHNPRDSDWNGIIKVTIEGERLIMTAMLPEEETRRLTPHDHKSVYERVANQE